MNFKTIGLNAAVVTAVAAGSALVMAPAQALSISGNAVFVNGASTTINFSTPYTNGNLAGGFTSVSGPLTVNSLVLSDITPSGGLANATGTLSNFISGFQYAGVNAFLSLDFGKFVKQTGIFNNAEANNGVFGTEFSGTIFKSGSTNVLGNYTGTFIATSSIVNPVGTFNVNINATPVPTPVLLPGLLALGVSILRKRKAEAEAVEAEA